MTTSQKQNPPSHIPLGLILPAAEYGSVDQRFRGIVLEQSVDFDPRSCANARRSRFATLVIDGPRTPMLLFAIQLGDALLSWLADPAESGISDAIDGWNANGSVSMALSGKETHLFVIPLTRKIDKTELLRPVKPVQSSDVFTTQAIETFTAGAIGEILDLPPSAKANYCLIHSAGVAAALERQGYEAKYVAKENKFLAEKSYLATVTSDYVWTPGR
ncbi:hypothetical protein OKW49_002767 [Paraburkholderia youngii]|uniref:hypothetical protein n=1 Tax=Paraburkholderia youngii TaxID=2782701 RepID=UPI003D2159F4